MRAWLNDSVADNAFYWLSSLESGFTVSKFQGGLFFFFWKWIYYLLGLDSAGHIIGFLDQIKCLFSPLWPVWIHRAHSDPGPFSETSDQPGRAESDLHLLSRTQTGTDTATRTLSHQFNTAELPGGSSGLCGIGYLITLKELSILKHIKYVSKEIYCRNSKDRKCSSRCYRMQFSYKVQSICSWLAIYKMMSMMAYVDSSMKVESLEPDLINRAYR